MKVVHEYSYSELLYFRILYFIVTKIYNTFMPIVLKKRESILRTNRFDQNVTFYT